MDRFGLRGAVSGAMLLLAGALPFPAEAGGSGLNTIVVVNQASSNSVQLANYFCERRNLPPENVLRISWSGGNTTWTASEFQTNLLSPLLELLAVRQLTNQVEYVVLSMDIPFATANGSTYNSTTAALFYGLKPDAGGSYKGVTNSYAGSEAIFSLARPASAPGDSFLATMLTAGSLEQAKRLVDQGVASDGTFPGQPAVLAKSSDPLRNIRYGAFDNAIFNARVRGNYSLVRTNSDSPWGQTNLLGYQTGLAGFSVSPGTFVPGAMADSMTSYGGVIFGPNGQTSLLAFIHAGASGGYGTVAEPQVDAAKFPDPQVYFFQARGFSLAECYYQSLIAPYLGLIVGEPLAAPFAATASGRWLGLATNTVLGGVPELSVQFDARDGDHPLQQVDLFVDGKYLRTLTNIVPCPGNLVGVTLNGRAITYAIPANSSLATVAAGLAALLNASDTTNATRVVAAAHGDRLELRATAVARPVPPGGLRVSAPPTPPAPTGNPVPMQTPPSAVARLTGDMIRITVGSSVGGGSALSTFLSASRGSFLDSDAYGLRRCSVNGMIQVGSWIQLAVTKTNGIRVDLAVTNQSNMASLYDLAQQLVTAVNSTPDLAGGDGLVAEDLRTTALGGALFNFRARSPGFGASTLQVQLTSSDTVVLDPSAAGALTGNLSDLQPRNHLYVTAGATNLTVSFPLDTLALPDGCHELTAVAYEGSHVRAQTRAAIPVVISNTALSAAMTLTDLPDTAPVQGSYHIHVAANTNAVSRILLYSTGGALGSLTNQSAGTFLVDSARLGVGRHPFYALVETPSGSGYRTETRWVRFTAGP